MAQAGNILVSESSLNSGEAQLHLLNIQGTGGGDTFIIQAPEAFIADLTGVNMEVGLSEIIVEVDLQDLKVDVELGGVELEAEIKSL